MRVPYLKTFKELRYITDQFGGLQFRDTKSVSTLVIENISSIDIKNDFTKAVVSIVVVIKLAPN